MTNESPTQETLSKSPRRPMRIVFGIKSILLMFLVVSAYMAGGRNKDIEIDRLQWELDAERSAGDKLFWIKAEWLKVPGEVLQLKPDELAAINQQRLEYFESGQGEAFEKFWTIKKANGLDFREGFGESPTWTAPVRPHSPPAGKVEYLGFEATQLRAASIACDYLVRYYESEEGRMDILGNRERYQSNVRPLLIRLAVAPPDGCAQSLAIDAAHVMLAAGDPAGIAVDAVRSRLRNPTALVFNEEMVEWRVLDSALMPEASAVYKRYEVGNPPIITLDEKRVFLDWSPSTLKAQFLNEHYDLELPDLPRNPTASDDSVRLQWSHRSLSRTSQ